VSLNSISLRVIKKKKRFGDQGYRDSGVGPVIEEA